MKKILLLIIAFAVVFTISTVGVQAASSINGDADLSEILDDWKGPDISITYDGVKDLFETDFDITDYKIDNDGEEYYVSKDGDDANDGLTLATAFLTLEQALSQTDVDTVYIDSGVYEATANRTYSADAFNIIGLDDDVYITGSRSYAGWTLTTSQTYTFEKTLTGGFSADNVRDKSNGWAAYTEQTSIAEVEAAAGSFYFDDATDTVYVHALDGLEPTEDVQVVSYYAFYFDDCDVYMEDVNIYAASQTFTAINSDVALNNVKLFYSDTHNGLTIKSSMAYLFEVEAAYNYLDGFNYHNYSGNDLGLDYHAIEIDTVAHNNGLVHNTGYDQGSTAHEDFQVIRVNAEYHGNNGANMMDIDNVKSWNFGVNGHDSLTDYDYDKGDLVTSYLFNPVADSTLGIRDNVLPFKVYYSLTYQTQIEATISSDFYQEDDVVLLPDDPVRTGYAFDGWYEDSTFTSTFSLVEMPGEKVIAYARWIPAPSNGGIIAAPDGTLSFLGLAWYWWVAIGVGGYALFFTKKGRKAIGLK